MVVVAGAARADDPNRNFGTLPDGAVEVEAAVPKPKPKPEVVLFGAAEEKPKDWPDEAKLEPNTAPLPLPLPLPATVTGGLAPKVNADFGAEVVVEEELESSCLK